MTDKLDKAKWIAYQELNDDDIMDAIQGSVAIPLAIKYNDWDYAFQLIKQRIENKMIRRAEFLLHYKTRLLQLMMMKKCVQCEPCG